MPPPHPSKTLHPVICCPPFLLFSLSLCFILSIQSIPLRISFPLPLSTISLYLFSLSRFSTTRVSSLPPLGFVHFFRTTVNSRTCCARHSRGPSSLRYLWRRADGRRRGGGVPRSPCSGLWLVAKTISRCTSLLHKPSFSSISLHPSLGIGYCKVLAETCPSAGGRGTSGGKRVYSAGCATPLHRRRRGPRRRVVSGLGFSTSSPLFVKRRSERERERERERTPLPKPTCTARCAAN